MQLASKPPRSILPGSSQRHLYGIDALVLATGMTGGL